MDLKNITKEEKQIAAAAARFFANELRASHATTDITKLLQRASNAPDRLKLIIAEHAGVWEHELLLDRLCLSLASTLCETYKGVTIRAVLNGKCPIDLLEKMADYIEQQ